MTPKQAALMHIQELQNATTLQEANDAIEGILNHQVSFAMDQDDFRMILEEYQEAMDRTEAIDEIIAFANQPLKSAL